MAYPRFQRSRDFKQFTRTGGDLTLNSTSWADLPTIGTTWDATLPAEAGDILEAGLSGVIDSAAVIVYFDVQTIVSGSALNSFGSRAAVATANKGVAAWYCAVSVLSNLAGGVMYPVVAGDLTSGSVTVRLRYLSSAATARNLHATVDYPLHWYVKNLGPGDPN